MNALFAKGDGKGSDVSPLRRESATRATVSVAGGAPRRDPAGLRPRAGATSPGPTPGSRPHRPLSLPRTSVARLTEFLEWLRVESAARGFQYVDLHDLLGTADFVDSLHLTAEGNRRGGCARTGRRGGGEATRVPLRGRGSLRSEAAQRLHVERQIAPSSRSCGSRRRSTTGRRSTARAARTGSGDRAASSGRPRTCAW